VALFPPFAVYDHIDLAGIFPLYAGQPHKQKISYASKALNNLGWIVLHNKMKYPR
jgi:hypothetical protein